MIWRPIEWYDDQSNDITTNRMIWRPIEWYDDLSNDMTTNRMIWRPTESHYMPLISNFLSIVYTKKGKWSDTFGELQSNKRKRKEN